jgi:hypothetical protein
MLFFPTQLAKILQESEKYPHVPHSVGGCSRLEYRQNQETGVKRLNQFYAITDYHLKRYFKFVDEITSDDKEIEELIGFLGGDLIISRKGIDLSRTHTMGAIKQDLPGTKSGVATFTLNVFFDKRKKIIQMLNSASNPN